MKRLILILPLILFSLSIVAQPLDSDSINTATFYYKPSDTKLYARYQSNSSSLIWLNNIIERNKQKLLAGDAHFAIFGFIESDDTQNADAINRASTEGSVLRAYLKTNYEIDHSRVTFDIDTTQNTCNRVLIEYVDKPMQKTENSIISYTLRTSEEPWVLKAIAGYEYGVPFTSLTMRMAEDDIAYANSNDFYRLEQGAWVPEDFSAYEEIEQTPMQEPTNEYHASAATEETYYTLIEPKERKKVFGLKTNTLYWLAALPNLEAEFYIGSMVSIAAEGHYNYLDGVLNNQIYHVTGGSAEVRFWFRPDGKFNGFYAGIYGSKGFYDVDLDFLGSVGSKCDYVSGGLSFGYVQPLGENFSMEFGVAGGYIDYTVERYTLTNGVKMPAKNALAEGWAILPTKAKVTLVWKF